MTEIVRRLWVATSVAGRLAKRAAKGDFECIARSVHKKTVDKVVYLTTDYAKDGESA